MATKRSSSASQKTLQRPESRWFTVHEDERGGCPEKTAELIAEDVHHCLDHRKRCLQAMYEQNIRPQRILDVLVELPVEVQLHVLEEVVAEQYPRLHLRSEEDINLITSKMLINSHNRHVEEELRPVLEKAIFTTTKFSLDITFLTPEPSIPNRNVVIHIPTTVASFTSKIRHLFIPLHFAYTNLGPNYATAVHKTTSAIPSLKAQFPSLKSLTFNLDIDGTRMVHEKLALTAENVKKGIWLDYPSQILLAGSPPSFAKATIGKAIGGLLTAAKAHFPGVRLILKLVVKRYPHREPNTYHSMEEKKFVCEDIEFSQLDDVDQAIHMALRSGEAARLSDKERDGFEEVQAPYLVTDYH